MNLRNLAPLGVALIWGVNIPVMKGAIGYVHPFVFNTLRLTLSVVVLGWMDYRARAGKPSAPTPWPSVIVVGLLVGYFYQLLFLGGMGRTSAGHTAVLIGSGPIWTAIIGRMVGMERPSPLTWLGLSLAFAGAVLVVSDDSGNATSLGDALVAGAAIAWASGTVLSKHILKGMDALRLTYLYALIVLPLHWATAWPYLDVTQLQSTTPAFWGAVVYSGVLSTGVAYALWNLGLVAVGPARTAVYVNLVPVIATVIAWTWLNEPVGTAQATGGLVVVAGLLLVQRFRTSG